MRKGQATPEVNNGLKLTQVVQTRTPLEAFNMLRMGHSIDQEAGYYDKLGILEDDFYMMDKVGKLHALAKYRELTMQHKSDIDDLYKQHQAAQDVTKQHNDNGEAENT